MNKRIVNADQHGTLLLGRQGENEVTEIVFSIPSDLTTYDWLLNHRRATDKEPYPIPLASKDNTLVWTVTAGDTDIPGRGYAELTCYGNSGEVLKSQLYATTVIKALTNGLEVPDPVQPWYESLLKRIDSVSGVTPEDISAAVESYLEENPIEVPEVDLTGVVKSVNGVEPDESGNVEIEVPEGTNGLPEYSESDNGKVLGIVEGSPAWVKATISGGDSSGDANTHNIVWNLINVTSSNNVDSVSDGASLVAVLTADSGYSLGNVTVTMGGDVLTGVWSADTATVTIASVTGDVMISCAGVKKAEAVDTSPVIEVEGYGLTSSGFTSANENWGYTKFYEVSDTSFTMCATNTEGVTYPSSNGRMTIFLNGDEYTNKYTGLVTYMNPYNTAGSPATKDASSFTFTGIRATLLLAEVENAYLYETNTGRVIFAGKNTEYYGKTNINEVVASASVLSFDDDIAQNYTVATASILGEETETDTGTAYGISSDLAAVIDEVRTAWMTEYGGDPRKIPLIITTDQHGRTNAGIFNMLGKTLSLHDVSKICNLGDTCSNEWIDADGEHSLLTCAALENWCESIAKIPFSKRLDVYGNHDSWYYDGYSVEGNTIGTRYPATMHHLDQYFRNIYMRRNNNHGWGVVRDDYFNVKYLIVTGFEYKDGLSSVRISTAQMKQIIDELSKEDGYDVVIMSHMPLYYQVSTATYPTGMAPEDTTATAITRFSGIDTDALFNARKNKTGGTITDSEGVEHSFDFSGCATEILCGLNGHMHLDAYNHIGGNGLANMTFDWFDGNTVHFVLVDRVNRQLNIWKLEGDALSYTNYQVPMDKQTE